MSKDINTFLFFLCVQALALLDEGHHSTETKNNGGHNQSGNKTNTDKAYDKGNNSTSDRTRSPEDVAALKTQEFKGLL